MSNALLEIGCEEIPARFMPGFLEDLKNKAEEKLRRERIGFSKVQTLGTYRRLTLYIENIASRQEDLSEEVKGPPAEKAFDASGKPTQAALGFAKSLKVTLDALTVQNIGKKSYVLARVLRKGKPTERVLSSIFPEIISSLYQPQAMRWGEVGFKFIRPIHWIVALCGSKIVRFSLAGIRSSDKTRGHRYKKLKIPSGRLRPEDSVRGKPSGRGPKSENRYYKQQLSGQGLRGKYRVPRIYLRLPEDRPA